MEKIETFLRNIIFYWVVTLVLAALGLTGRFSAAAADFLFGVAWVLGCLGLWRSGLPKDLRLMCGLFAGLAAVLLLLSYWRHYNEESPQRRLEEKIDAISALLTSQGQSINPDQLLAKYPLGYAIYDLDYRGEKFPYQKRGLEKYELDWRDVGVKKNSPDLIEVRLPDVSLKGGPKLLTNAVTGGRRQVGNLGGAAFGDIMMWGEILAIRPSGIVFLVGFDKQPAPAVIHPPGLAPLMLDYLTYNRTFENNQPSHLIVFIGMSLTNTGAKPTSADGFRLSLDAGTVAEHDIPPELLRAGDTVTTRFGALATFRQSLLHEKARTRVKPGKVVAGWLVFNCKRVKWEDIANKNYRLAVSFRDVAANDTRTITTVVPRGQKVVPGTSQGGAKQGVRLEQPFNVDLLHKLAGK